MNNDGTQGMRPLLSYATWLSLEKDVRKELVRIFEIPRTGESIVHIGAIINNNIAGESKQDGHKPEDLYAITTEKMQHFVNSESTDFHALFDEVIAMIKGTQMPMNELHPIVDTPVVPAPATPQEEFVPRPIEELIKPKTDNNAKTPAKKRGRPAKAQ